MIGVTFVPSAGVRRTLASLVRLLNYFASPKPGQPLHSAGERLLCRPRTAWIGAGRRAIRGPRMAWASDMARQMSNSVRRSRRSAGMPRHLHHHIVFSFHPADSSRLGSTRLQRAEMAIQLCRMALARGGLDLHPAILAVHGDREHLHVHVAIAACDLRGKIWSPGRRTFHRLDEALAELEIRFSLVRVLGRRVGLASDSEAPRHGHSLTSLESWHEATTGQMSLRRQIRQELDECLSNGASPEAFAANCLSRGIRVLPRVVDGCVIGNSFKLGEGVFSGSSLGSSYAWPAVRDRIGFREGNPRHQEIVREWCRIDREEQKAALCSIEPLGDIEPGQPRAEVPRTLERRLVVESVGEEVHYRWTRSRRLAVRVKDAVILLARPTLKLIRLGLALAAAKGWGALRVLAPGFAAPLFEEANKRTKKKIRFAASESIPPVQTVIAIPTREVDPEPESDVPIEEERTSSRYREEARARSRGPRRPGFP